MMNNPKTKLTKAKIEKEKDTTGPSRISTANPYRKDNVNVAMGPRMGNEGTPAKRREFTAAKVTREPLADMIVDAFAGRGRDDKETFKPGLESVSANTRAKFK
jgi:hypothetical protein